MSDYWKCCIEEALSDAKVNANDEKIETIACWVEGAHENHSMAMGYDCIPTLESEEIEALKSKIKAMESQHNRIVNGVIAGVARRRGVSESDVTIDSDGLVEYRR